MILKIGIILNTTDTQCKRSIMLLHDDIFRDIIIVHIFNDD